jgi:hypothetical protein
MADLFASVAGHRVITAKVVIPNIGVWFADLTMDESTQVSGRVEVIIDSMNMSGTVAPEYQASFGSSRKLRVVGGAYGWHISLPRRAYHNDAGVKASTVAYDLAKECGETIGSFSPTTRLGQDYVRKAGPASEALEEIIDGTPWWVNLAGSTIVGSRPEFTPSNSTYQLMGFDGMTRLATLVADDMTKISIGMVLVDDRLGAPQTVREIEYVMEAGQLRAIVWCGGDATGYSRLARSVSSIVKHVNGAKIFGKWRYRVLSMDSDRVNLQAVRKDAGLPDILPVVMKPGVAGAFAELTPSTEVLVEFIEGDPANPIIDSFAGKGEAGFSPKKLIFAADSMVIGEDSNSIEMGNSATVTLGPKLTAKPVARVGDSVTVVLPPLILAGNVLNAIIMGPLGPNPQLPLPITGTASYIPGQTLGTISTGSLKVKSG